MTWISELLTNASTDVSSAWTFLSQHLKWIAATVAFLKPLALLTKVRLLEETRRLATREGWRYRYVQAIIVAIDQYAEAATGNRDFFLNKPPGVRRGNVP